MDANLVTVLKQIINERGDSVLSEPRRVSAYLLDLARDVPKPQKNALIKCLEHGFAQTYRTVAAPERAECKQKLAQRLHEEEGLDLGLCGETFDLLGVVLFGEEAKKNYCKNCGKELQEGWKSCPYCGQGTAAAQEIPKTTPQSQPPFNTTQPKINTPKKITAPKKAPQSQPPFNTTQPEVNTPKKITVPKQYDPCEGCHYANTYNGRCKYYGMSISEAKKLDCGYKTPEKQTVAPDTNVKTVKECKGCRYANNNTGWCNYYLMDIYKAVKYDCGYKK